MSDLNCDAGECQCGLIELPERLRESLSNNSLAAMRADIEFLLGRLKCRYAGQTFDGPDDDAPCEEPEKCDGLPPCVGWKRRPLSEPPSKCECGHLEKDHTQGGGPCGQCPCMYFKPKASAENKE